jgi:hypothetical protein
MRQIQPGGLYKPCLRDPRAQSSRVPTADSTALGLRPLLQRTALSRPRWTTGRMGQTGQIPGWPPVSFWCHSNSLSLLSGITVSAKLANSLCVSGYRLCNRGYCLCIRNVSAISADFLWICILAGSYPCIRAALSIYLSAFPYLSKGRNLTKKLVRSALADICTKHKYAVHIYIYVV